MIKALTTDTAVSAILGRFDKFEARFDKFEAEVNARLARIEAKLDEKLSHADVWRSSATITGLAFALVFGTIAVLKTIGALA